MERAVNRAKLPQVQQIGPSWKIRYSHMVDLMLYCSFSVSPLQQRANCPIMSRASLNSQSSSHTGETSKGAQRLDLRLNILYMQTHSWPKQNRLAWPAFQKHLQFKSRSRTFTRYNEAHICRGSLVCEMLGLQAGRRFLISTTIPCVTLGPWSAESAVT